MASLKALRRRISSIKGTHQIMKAMNLVATSKLQRSKARLDAIRPMFAALNEAMQVIASYDEAQESVYFTGREVKNIAYVVVSSDRGLCGGYNINVSKEALAIMKKNAGKSEFIITAGLRGHDYLRRRGKTINYRIPGASDHFTFTEAKSAGDILISEYLKGGIDEAYVVYTRFNSVLSHTPVAARILPIGVNTEGSDGEKGANDAGFMSFDPDFKGFLEYSVPMYINNFIHGAIVEAAVCEQAARMTSMDSAANNAEDIIDDLTLAFLRKRQSVITQEITEIVSGANALQ